MSRRKRKAASLDRITRASIPVECQGKTYYFTPLALTELAMVERWAQQEPFKRLGEKIKAMGISDDSPLAMEMLKTAEKQSDDRDFISTQLESLAGVQYAIKLGFMIKHKDMSDQTFMQIMDDKGFGFLKQLMEESTNLNEEEVKN